MSDLITSPIPNAPQINLVNYLTDSVWLNHWSIIECSQNQLSKIANRECLLKSIANYQMYPEPTQQSSKPEISSVKLLQFPF